jgi:hypothetical protein
MINHCVLLHHWHSVTFLIKSDIDGWLQRLVANDTLQPFTSMVKKFVDGPFPLSQNIRPDFALSVQNL